MAMSDHHKTILQVNRTNFLKNIGDVKAVVASLLAKGVITEFMEEEILAKETNTAKIQELMSLLPRRGEKAFDEFYEVLVENEEFVAADFIKPELKEFRLAQNAEPNHITHMSPSIASSHIEELPSVFPDPADDMVNIVVKKCETEEMKSKLKQPSIYSLKKPIRGLCVVINNEYFFSAADRRGTQKDLDALQKLFHQLHFTVEPHHNQTASEMKDILKRYTDLDHSNFDCFVFIVLSHGKNGSVCGVDGNTVEIDEIITSFDARNCKSLVGKPKLFFIQACRGDKIDNGITVVDDKDVIEITNKVQNLNLHAQKESTDSRTGNMAITSDMYIAMATMPGYVCWRAEETGSRFIHAIVYAFKNYSHLCNLNSLMTKVNALVKITEGINKQAPVSTSSLHKELYFFPGLAEQTHPAMQH